jgi:hypothetical protein
VERKRMDDLGKSIKDTRFHEQKVIADEWSKEPRSYYGVVM